MTTTIYTCYTSCVGTLCAATDYNIHGNSHVQDNTYTCIRERVVEYFEFKEAIGGRHICVGDVINTCIGEIVVGEIIDDCDGVVGVVGTDESGEELFVSHGEIFSVGECW